ncbi:MAG TPA: DNA gyrase modulator, partial [Terriglobales bacterium]|nr:DNA gyrase modulator [Terriglobales bacterium]
MKELASWALDTATQRGATYADVRVGDDRSRALATKNGKIGNASDSRSQGFNIRVIVDGAWGFASSAELSRASVEATAAQAVAVARASAKVKQKDVQLVPENAVTAEWTTPHKIDPFSTSIEQNLALLQKIDSELRSVQGITLAETNLNFRRDEQWFFSSEGANIHQT